MAGAIGGNLLQGLHPPAGTQSAGHKHAPPVHSAKEAESNGQALANKAHKGGHSQPTTDDVHKQYIKSLTDNGGG